MFPGAVEGIRDYFASRAMTKITHLKVDEPVKVRIRKLIAAGGVPILYANHQSHTDGMAIAAIAKNTRKISGSSIKGFATLLAASMEHGQQGEELKSTFDLLVGGARRMGVVAVSSTRKKDEAQYGMSREQVFAELRPFVQALNEGYGIAILPEGTVEGGRHPKGESIENIKGIQEVTNNNLIDFFTMASRVLSKQEKWPFYLPAGLHGSFRIMQAPEGDKPKLTGRGKLSLIMGVIGLPYPLRIQATLLMPFTEEEIVADLGANWMKDGPAFNRYAMGTKIAPFLPEIARGVCAS